MSFNNTFGRWHDKQLSDSEPKHVKQFELHSIYLFIYLFIIYLIN